MLKLLEEARVRAFWRPGAHETAPETAVVDASSEVGAMTLIARQEIEYLAPVPYQRPPLDVQMWFGALGGSSLEVCYEVFSGEGHLAAPVLYARATVVIVMVSVETGRPVRLTNEQRSVWSQYVGEPIVYAHRR